MQGPLSNTKKQSTPHTFPHRQPTAAKKEKKKENTNLKNDQLLQIKAKGMDINTT
jgi:hypothetical protein